MAGKPSKEGVVAHGHFVMNTEEHIKKVSQDLTSIAFGAWTE